MKNWIKVDSTPASQTFSFTSKSLVFVGSASASESERFVFVDVLAPRRGSGTDVLSSDVPAHRSRKQADEQLEDESRCG